MDERTWMYSTSRTSDQYLKGLKSFITAAEVDMSTRCNSAMWCPCKDCSNNKQYSSSHTVHAHLIIRGFMDDYRIWNKHGEEGDNNQDLQDSHVDDALPRSTDGLFRRTEEDDPSHAYTTTQELNDEDIVQMGEQLGQMPDKFEEMVQDAMWEASTEKEIAKLEALMKDAKLPVYPECPNKYTKVFSCLKLLQIKAANHWTDRSFQELLNLLRDMLPKGNQIPETTYDTKQTICPFGLTVEKIHACKNDCILFRGEYEELMECPECGTQRYKRRKDGGDEDKRHGGPQKVVWYFPIVPRLKRMFASRKESQLLRWHRDGRKKDDYLRHSADSIQWHNIETKYGEFANDPRNIWFVLSTDGMNPFGNMSSSHSVWPVLLSIYNLPPWLCNKRKYMLMPMLIQGPKQPGNDIDVFLRPVVEEFKILWNGITVVDRCTGKEFTLKAILFTTVADIPGHRSLSGQSKGDNDCFQCLDDTETMRLNNCKKQVYTRHRRFLPTKHPYRKMKRQFDGTMETAPPPKNFSGEYVYNQVKDVEVTFGKKRKLQQKKLKEKDKSNRNKMWKKRSILWELPYWKDLTVRHSIDVMHIKKNVCESLLGTLMNDQRKTKDHEQARADLEDLDIRPELCPGDNSLPLSAINLTKLEKKELCDFFRNVKVPSGYSSNITKLVSVKEQKMLPMKANDCDVILTTMLAVGIRNILPEKPRKAIMSLCFFFNAISQRFIDERTLDSLEQNMHETMCLLEAYFPPSFFDISVHLITHLVKEIRYLGPAFLHHMYPYERFMSTLNRYTKNRARPEGSMVQGYSAEEVIDWCLDYIDPENSIGNPKPRHHGRTSGVGILGEKAKNPELDAYEKAHFLVLQHTEEVSPYIDEHKEMLARENPGRGQAWLSRAHTTGFSKWFRTRIELELEGSTTNVESLRNLSRGPLFTVNTYQGYDINGYTFYTVAQDNKSTYQNSGIRIQAYENGNSQIKSAYYGQIEEIWELTYPDFRIPIFRCRWIGGGKKGVQKDQYGFTTVDLNHVGYREDPFVLASQVSQVFYVTDTIKKERHVVLPGKSRILVVDDAMQEEEYRQFDEIPRFATFQLPKILPSELTPYLRTDHTDRIRIRAKRQKKL